MCWLSLNGRMVKRKVEFNPEVVQGTERSDLRAGLTTKPDHSEPSSSTSDPTGEGTHGGPSVSHVGPAPATVAEEGKDVANAFWALLASAGYQVW